MVPRYFNHFSTDQKPCFNSQMAALVYGQDREMGPINLQKPLAQVLQVSALVS